MEERHAERQARVKRIVHELGRIRWHGLDELDLNSHGKPALPDKEAEVVAEQAQTYNVVIGKPVSGRAAEIRQLLSDGLAAYGAQRSENESQFIRRLFFDPQNRVPKVSPGTLLDEAYKATNMSEDRFNKQRRIAFTDFAGFLLDFVAATRRAPEASAPTTDAAEPATAQQIQLVLAEPVVPVTEPEPEAPTTAGTEPEAAEPAAVPTSAASTPPPLAGAAGAANTPQRAWRQPSVVRMVVAAASLLVIGGIVLALVLAHTLGNGAAGHAPAATSGHSTLAGAHTEIAGEYGSSTFSDPHSPGTTGPRLESYEQVRVSCKVFAPTIKSISPDGYWYRLVSPQPVANLYAPATNFLNGDPVVGARKHYTDFAVPDCPS